MIKVIWENRREGKMLNSDRIKFERFKDKVYRYLYNVTYISLSI